MSLRDRLRVSWRNVFHPGHADRELDEELAAYLELLVDEKVRAGLSPEAARRAALVEMGGIEQVKERVRDVRAGVLADQLVRDVRQALRSLGRARAFTAAAVLALGLGIGATAAVFSVVNGVLLQPLPYRQPDRLVVVLHRGTDPVAVANFLDWRRQSRSYADMGAADYWTPNLSGTETPEKVWALKVTPNLFSMLGTGPALGRLFLPDEEEPGRNRVVLIAHSLWQRRFAGDAGIIGREILLNGEPHTVIGVMPRGFQFAPFWATRAELWVPLWLGDRASNRGGNSLRVFARLADGVTLEQARGEMATITARLEAEFPGSNRDVQVVPLEERVLGDVRVALLVLLGAVGFVLLIACANVAHLLLARASARPPRDGGAHHARRHALAHHAAVSGRRAGAVARGRPARRARGEHRARCAARAGAAGAAEAQRGAARRARAGCDAGDLRAHRARVRPHPGRERAESGAGDCAP